MVIEQQLRMISKKIIERTMRMDLTWDWSCGVAYYGICRVYEVLQDDSIIDALKERVDEMIELGAEGDWTVNKCAMGHCLITLYERTGDQKYLDLIMKKIDYLKNRAIRFGDGVLQHTVSSRNDFPEQVWADTLFMAAFFMLRVGVMIQDETLIADALNQYYWHISYLQDLDTGLFYHGYDNLQQSHLSSCHWGRANAWAAYTMAQVRVRLPEAYLYPKYMDIQASLEEQLSSLKFFQGKAGLWRTVIDDLETYEEISASAGIAASMIVNDNPLHRKYVEKAMNGLLDNIATDGRVMNVSAGTAVMRKQSDYNLISKKWIQGWGQGLALTFFAETLSNEQLLEFLLKKTDTDDNKDLLIPSNQVVTVKE